MGIIFHSLWEMFHQFRFYTRKIKFTKSFMQNEKTLNFAQRMPHWNNFRLELTSKSCLKPTLSNL